MFVAVKRQISPGKWKRLTADSFVPAIGFLTRAVSHNSFLCWDEIRPWSGRGGGSMPAYNKTTSAAMLRLIPSSLPVDDISQLKFPDSAQTMSMTMSSNQIYNENNASENEQVVPS